MCMVNDECMLSATLYYSTYTAKMFYTTSCFLFFFFFAIHVPTPPPIEFFSFIAYVYIFFLFLSHQNHTKTVHPSLLIILLQLPLGYFSILIHVTPLLHHSVLLMPYHFYFIFHFMFFSFISTHYGSVFYNFPLCLYTLLAMDFGVFPPYIFFSVAPPSPESFSLIS